MALLTLLRRSRQRRLRDHYPQQQQQKSYDNVIKITNVSPPPYRPPSYRSYTSILPSSSSHFRHRLFLMVLYFFTTTNFSPFSTTSSSSTSSVLFVNGDAICPSNCHGNGLCSNQLKCECFDGWTGLDCGKRACPAGPVWASKVQGKFPLFTPRDLVAECSGKGICKNDDATCVCADGYGGAACEKLACLPMGNPCYSRGQCVDLVRLQRMASTTGAITDLTTLYSVWDANRIYTCNCDPGYGGIDCSLLDCPMSDNPYTDLQQQPVIRILFEVSPSATTLPNRKFRFHFAGHTSLVIPLADLSNDNCLTFFTSTLNLNPVGSRCKVQGPNKLSLIDGYTMLNAGQYEVVIALNFPILSAQNHWFRHDGDPPASLFGCFIDPFVPENEAAGTSCSVTRIDVNTLSLVDDTTPVIPEDTSYQISVSDDTVYPNKVIVTKTIAGAPPVVTHLPAITIGTDATGVRIHTGENVYIRFNSLWGHTVDATWTIASKKIDNVLTNYVKNPTIREYGFCGNIGICDFTAGKCSCPEGYGGLSCELPAGRINSIPNAPVLDLVSYPGDYTGTVMKLTTKRPLSVAYNFITAQDNDNDPVFRVRGDGGIIAASLDISTHATVRPTLKVLMSSTQAEAFQGLSLLSLYYGNDQLVPADFAPLIALTTEYPLDANDPDAYDAIRVNARTKGIENDRFTKLFSLRGDGRGLLHGGLDIDIGGLSINAGGLSVTAGGMIVQAGVTSLQGGVSITSGLGVRSGGASIIGGTMSDHLYISGSGSILGSIYGNGGLSLNAGGLAVNSGGVYVGAGGLSVQSGNFLVRAGSMSLTNGAALFSNGANTASSYFARLVGGGTATSGGAASFCAAANSLYNGDIVYIEGPNPASNTYNMLKMTSATSTLSFNQNNDITSTDSFLIRTSDQSGQSGDISLQVGTAGIATGGKVWIGAGRGAAGGDVRIRGGIANQNVGGNVYISGGQGISTGGNVILQPGSAGTNGEVLVNDGTGTTRLAVTSDGQLIFSPSSGTAASIVSGNNPIVTSASILSLTASTGIVVQGQDDPSGTNPGGAISLIGGENGGGSDGGSIDIRPGSSSSGTPGKIQIHSAKYGGGQPKRIVITDTETTFFSEFGVDKTAITIEYGQFPNEGISKFAGSLSIGGTSTLYTGAFVGTSLYLDGWQDMSGTLSLGGNVIGNGNIEMNGNGNIGGTLRSGNTLTVASGGADVTGDILVTAPVGILVATGGISVTSDIIGKGNLDVLGSGTVTGGITIGTPGITVTGGGADISGRILVTGSTSMSGSLSVGGNLLANGYTSILGSTTVTGTMHVDGASKFTDSILLPSPAFINANGGSIMASGSTGMISAGGRLFSGGTASIAGATTIVGTTLAVDKVTMSGGSDITGNVVVTNGGITVVTAGTLGRFAGALSVGGTSSLHGQIYNTNGMKVIQGDIEITEGNFNIVDSTKSASIQGTLYSQYLSAGMFEICTATSWSTGPCSTISNFNPATATRVQLYWNADTVSHTVAYGAGYGSVTISPGAIFPVFLV